MAVAERHLAVSERLKAARAVLKLTQAEAALKFEMPIGSLRKYESGPSIPGGEAIAGIVKAGINANWLLTGEGPMLMAELRAIQEHRNLLAHGRVAEAGRPYGVTAEVDSLLLQQVADVFFAWMHEHRDNVRIDRSRWGAVIAVLYRVASKSGKAEKAELEQVLSIAA